MENTMSSEIIKVLDYLGSQIGVFVDWSTLIAEDTLYPTVMDILNRWVKYQIATTSVWLFIGLILSSYAIYNIFSLNKKCKSGDESVYDDGYEDFTPRGYLMLGTAIAAAVFGAPMFLANLFNLIELIVLPEIVIYEEIAKMLG